MVVVLVAIDMVWPLVEAVVTVPVPSTVRKVVPGVTVR